MKYLTYQFVNILLFYHQVVTDMRLWLRDAISTLLDDGLKLISTLVERAAAYGKHTRCMQQVRVNRLDFI